ncbi:MAG: hypothetical protein OEW35_13100 [Gammaproteobacteria bacterium]|nr:hypothetical protein [Gammaproteobacteria bacterium]MDH4254364.1 hypothetical protein [Gammaproteobacteria bacterium]MDH5309381.1 hypothetical protein [Gammaproteobacteria bacterium]
MQAASWGLGPRLLLAPVPAVVGYAAWSPLNARFLFEDDWYVYFWYPPVMDVLFGLLVLAPFVVGPRPWPRVLALVVVSIVAHAFAVAAVVHSQWLPVPAWDLRFLAVLPIAILVTLVLVQVTLRIARVAPVPGSWRHAPVAGTVAGVFFVITMETDSAATSWLYEHGLPWMLWHVASCIAIYSSRGTGPWPMKEAPR